jgi:hypothetical protein
LLREKPAALKLSAAPADSPEATEEPVVEEPPKPAALKLSAKPASEPETDPAGGEGEVADEAPAPVKLAAPPRANRAAVALAKPKVALADPKPAQDRPEAKAPELTTEQAEVEAEAETCPAAPVGDGSFGGRLRAAREAAGHTVEQTAEATRIRADFVRALEDENFTKLPRAAVYTKSYVRTLAKEYDLDAVDLIDACEAAMSAADLSIHPEPTLRDSTKLRQAQVAAGDEPAPSPSPVVWVLGGLVAVIGVILIAFAIMTRGGAVAPPPSGIAPADSVSEEDVEMLLTPELLPFSELEVPTSQPVPPQQ